MKRNEQIQRELISLDKDKKNYARRINYKISKLKTELESLLESNSNEDVIEEKAVENTKEDIELEEKFDVLDNPKSFTIAFDDGLDYDIKFNNMWHNVHFSVLKPKDFLRIRSGSKVLEFYGSKYLTPLGIPHYDENDVRVLVVKKLE